MFCSSAIISRRVRQPVLLERRVRDSEIAPTIEEPGIWGFN